MSFDVFFQGFRNGEGADSGRDQMLCVLAPFIEREEPEHDFASVKIGDGSADIYLGDSHMLANHISGSAPWDLLVRGAREADWVILPVGCPTCLTDDGQRSHLPAGLDADVRLVTTGEDLLRVINTS